MAITTLAGVIQGLQAPVSYVKLASGTLLANTGGSLWPVAGGSPAAGALQSGLNGAVYSTSSSVPTGSIARQDPLSGNAYLARVAIGGVTSLGKLLVCDRLWDNTVPNTTTGAQSITSPTWPARDRGGSTNGYGLLMGLEVTGAASATAAVCTIGYTDAANNNSLTSALIDLPTSAAPGIGRFYRMGYSGSSANGGVRSIQNINFSTAWTSGTFGIVVYRVLAVLDMQVALQTSEADALSLGFPQLYNGTTPFFLIIQSSTLTNILTALYQETNG